MSQTQELAPAFEAALMLHDGIMPALAAVSAGKLLPVDAARKVLLAPEKYPYKLLAAPDGRPYAQMAAGQALKRYYIFADADEIDNPARMFALVCNVTRDARTGIILVMPEEIIRGPEADFVMSVKYGCCTNGGRTFVYSDTSQSKGVFANIRSSGSDVREYIRDAWDRLQVQVLDANGMAALHHLSLDLTGRCAHGANGHAARANYTAAGALQGRGLRPS